jgi:hypothetical protein
MKETSFGIIGGGWRAAFYLRIARALPEHFRVAGMMVRNQEKGSVLEEKWGVKTYRTLDELLEHCECDFVVVAASRSANASFIKELASRDIPALTETPPADSLEDLISLHELTRAGARVQVAEQYIFQPMHAARLAIVASGLLGSVTQVQVSAAHGYHGMSLLRHYLGIGFEEAAITARKFDSPIVAGPARQGPPAKEKIVTSSQTIAWLDFQEKIGIFDFTGTQYFSWIRSPRILVRGERGEINNREVRYLKDFQTPVVLELKRQSAGEDGNLEGYYLKGILAGEEWVYRNPFAGARLSDEEIAVATVLGKLAEYAKGGASFYGLPAASQDTFLALMMDKAVETGEKVLAKPQIWVTTASQE